MTAQERRAKACHAQAIAIDDALEKMECPKRVGHGGCPLCKALDLSSELRVQLARLYPDRDL